LKKLFKWFFIQSFERFQIAQGKLVCPADYIAVLEIGERIFQIKFKLSPCQGSNRSCLENTGSLNGLFSCGEIGL
jgi:hypothetical protein